MPGFFLVSRFPGQLNDRLRGTDAWVDSRGWDSSFVSTEGRGTEVCPVLSLSGGLFLVLTLSLLRVATCLLVGFTELPVAFAWVPLLPKFVKAVH